MYEIIKTGATLLLQYQIDHGDAEWIDKELRNTGELHLRRTFTFSKYLSQEEVSILLPRDDYEPPSHETYYFLLGTLDGIYYKIESDILNTDHSVYILKDADISIDFFVAEGKISIFRKICSLSKEDIYIGGDSDNAIPIFDFKHLIEHFPNKYERDKYSESRITHILKNYLSTMKDAEYTHEKYIAKKDGRNTKSVIHPEIFTNEIQKYKFLLEKLRSMLNESEAYSENEWQKSIVEFILLLMPKYMTVLEKVKINDYYSKKQKTVKRECDLMLIDFNGYVDLIEIKKPFSNCLVQKNTYRDNYIPKRDISGSAVQLEKYSFHLSKWGHEGEKELSKVYAKQLPSDIRIKIANPKGIIIIGRSDLSECQILDFEIIRRQYSNIIDIITYDDLVHRLENTISILTHRQQG